MYIKNKYLFEYLLLNVCVTRWSAILGHINLVCRRVEEFNIS